MMKRIPARKVQLRIVNGIMRFFTPMFDEQGCIGNYDENS